jgi:hypothetical protein
MDNLSRFSDSINNYYNDELSQSALLIDGGWGEGKTYFITEVLTNYLSKGDSEADELDPTIKYVSLFGLETQKQIDRKLVSAMEDESIDQESSKNGLSKFFDEFTKKVSVSGSNDDTGVKGSIGLGILGAAANYLTDVIFDARLKSVIKSGALFCFDDLERWHGDIRIPLAYISHLVERMNAKVLVVCNTEKLDATEKNDDGTTKDGDNKLRFDLFQEKVIGKTISFSLSPEELHRTFDLLLEKSNLVKELFNNIRIAHPIPFSIEHLTAKNIRSIQKSITLFRDFCSRYEAFFLANTSEAKEVWITFEIDEQEKKDLNRSEKETTKASSFAKEYQKTGYFTHKMDAYFFKGTFKNIPIVTMPTVARIVNSKALFSLDKNSQEDVINDLFRSISNTPKLVLDDIFYAIQSLAVYSDLGLLSKSFENYFEKLQGSLHSQSAPTVIEHSLYDRLLDTEFYVESKAHHFENLATVKYHFEPNISPENMLYEFKDSTIYEKLKLAHKLIIEFMPTSRKEKSKATSNAWLNLLNEDRLPIEFLQRPNYSDPNDITVNLYRNEVSGYKDYIPELKAHHVYKLCSIFETNIGKMTNPETKPLDYEYRNTPKAFYGYIILCGRLCSKELFENTSKTHDTRYVLDWLTRILGILEEEWETTYGQSFDSYRERL